jgi:uncharacterized membrane protein
MKRAKKLPSDLPGGGRIPLLDLLRGLAIAMMVAYHFCFDLDYYGLIQADLNHDPFWLRWRAGIVTGFLLVMGASLWLAAGRGVRWRPYLRRLGLVAGAAALVSLSSWAMFPRSWIFFGVLHFIAVASVLGLAFVRLRWTNLVLGLLLTGVGVSFAFPFFDQPAWQWFGLMTYKPFTEDYVPLLPWFGVVLIGIFLGRMLFDRTPLPRFARWGSGTPVARGLAFAGRHSLFIYLAHQPLLLGLLWLLTRVA